MNRPSSARRIGIVETAAWTPAGDARATAEALLNDQILLKPRPFDWNDGEPVPLSLDTPSAETCPPRWWERLQAFAAPIANADWGTRRRPVFLTSSNFGVGNLFAYRCTGNRDHLAWGTPHACMERIREAFGWGPNVILLSHACVSAQLGLFQAQRLLEQGLADSALIFSFDFLSPFVVGGFHALKILNGEWPAPYTKRDTGSIGLGDGAAYAILSRETIGTRAHLHAQALHNELAHFTANRADGAGFGALLEQLPLDGMRLWVKGHGTGTLEAGRLEAAAVAAAVPGAPLVSWKGSLGHTLGSCALVELAVALAAVDLGRIPGTVGAGEKVFTPQVAREAFDAKRFNAILMLSNAFGGAHGGMVVGYA